MRLLFVALSAFFWWEVIKLYFPWSLPAMTQPVIISFICYAMWWLNQHANPALGYVFAGAGAVSIFAFLFGNPAAGWIDSLKKTPQRRVPPGSWPPGTKPGRNKPTMPRL